MIYHYLFHLSLIPSSRKPIKILATRQTWVRVNEPDETSTDDTSASPGLLLSFHFPRPVVSQPLLVKSVFFCYYFSGERESQGLLSCGNLPLSISLSFPPILFVHVIYIYIYIFIYTVVLNFAYFRFRLLQHQLENLPSSPLNQAARWFLHLTAPPTLSLLMIMCLLPFRLSLVTSKHLPPRLARFLIPSPCPLPRSETDKQRHPHLPPQVYLQRGKRSYDVCASVINASSASLRPRLHPTW